MAAYSKIPANWQEGNMAIMPLRPQSELYACLRRSWPDREFVQQLAAQLPWGQNMLLLDAVKAP
jgi:hypothetical protein